MVGGLLKSTSTLALMAAAGLLIGGVTLAPSAARAADLGGDCCADLEERVANLEATTARKGNKKVSLTISGRVSATMTYWMDSGIVNTAAAPAGNGPNDHLSDLYFGDVSGSGAEVNLNGSGKISSDMVAGYSINIGLGNGVGRGSNTQVNHQGHGSDAVTVGNTYVFLTSKHIGTVQLGRIDNSGDAYGVNFNSAVMGDGAARGTGSFFTRTATGLLTTRTYGSYIGGNTPGGENGIRFNSNNYGGFSLTASAHGDDIWGAGANYGGTFGTITVGAGVGVGSHSRVDGSSSFLGYSAGIKDSASGLFLNGKYNERTDVTTNRPSFTNIQGGWSKNVSGMGATTVWGGYAISKNTSNAPSEATSLSLGIDQALDSAASAIYLTYENTKINASAQADDVGDSISAVSAGMTVKF
jgi:hypothetical protein